MKIVKWIHPVTKEEEVVEKNSLRDIELREKLHNIGLWEEGAPNQPEGCISMEEYTKQFPSSKLIEEHLKTKT